ncbi:MAG: hypothetical protein QM831_14120 [Kofleriaceae bacterium]
MKRLALITLFAACGGSGFETGAANVSTDPKSMSASATSFNDADGAGTMVMGWKISLWEQADGADCMSADTHRVAAISIYTNQPVVSGKKAMLAEGEITLVADSPPTVLGNEIASMGAEKIGSIAGTLTIDMFHLKADLTADQISGSVNAAGEDANGNGVTISGDFVAPVCE